MSESLPLGLTRSRETWGYELMPPFGLETSEIERVDNTDIVRNKRSLDSG